MWVILSESDPDFRVRLVCGREYSVGRRDCDIILENDMSISRKHAVLLASHSDVNNPQKAPLLTVQDFSKLGTVINDKRIVKEKVIVSHGTDILFGNAGISNYRLEQESYILTTSCLDAAGKKSVRQLSVPLGAHVVSDWRKDCKLLVMTSLSITIKAICALIAQCPIVTPAYLEKLLDSLQKKTTEPEVKNYLPPLAESQLDPKLVSFHADPRRLKVFDKSLVIFLSAKQFKKLSVVVELGGGTPMLLEEGTDDNEDDILTGPGSCVMTCDPTDQSQLLTQNAKEWIKHVQKVLKKNKKRVIQECEIGYAVLYCSVQQYCNPDVDLAMNVQPLPVPGQTLSQMDITSQLREANRQHREEQPSLATQASLSLYTDTPQKTKTTVKPDVLKEDIHNPDTHSKLQDTHSKRRRVSDDEADVEPVSKRRSLQTKLSASVSPTRKQPSPKSKAIPEPKQQQQQDNETESLFTNLSRISTKKDAGKSKAHLLRHVVEDSDEDQKVPAEMFDDFDESGDDDVAERDEDEDMFSRIPTRSGQPTEKKVVVKKRQSAVPPVSPPRRSSRRSPSPASRNHGNNPPVSPPRRSSRRSPSPASRNHGNNPTPSHPGNSSAPSISPKRSPARQSPRRPIKSEPVSFLGDGENEEGTNEVEITRIEAKVEIKEEKNSQAPGTSTNNGFISRGGDHHMLEVDRQYESSAEFKSSMLIKEAVLAVRQPRQTSAQTSTSTSNTWRGRIVKNFKKFRKVGQSDLGLPTIIGGSDLVTHKSGDKPELERYKNELMESQSGSVASQQQIDDLFNYDPQPKGGTSAKGRRR